MIIFQISLKANIPIYKICNLSGLILYKTSKYPSIRKICKHLNGDYILADPLRTTNNEILVVKDENKPVLRDWMRRHRKTEYFYKKIYALLKINCYPKEYKLIYKLLELDAKFIRFYLNCKRSRLYKYMKHIPECFYFLPAKLRNDKQFIIGALDKYINIGEFLSAKSLKDVIIATKLLNISLVNINNLILVYSITPKFIEWCESFCEAIFCYIEPEYLFRLTTVDNGIKAISDILIRTNDNVLTQFYKFDMRATLGTNIREILKNNPDDDWLFDYAPRHIRASFSNRSVHPF
jgi:hypothetical protein